MASACEACGQPLPESGGHAILTDTSTIAFVVFAA